MQTEEMCPSLSELNPDLSIMDANRRFWVPETKKNRYNLLPMSFTTKLIVLQLQRDTL